MKTSISRDNIIETVSEGSKFRIFKDNDASVDSRFVVVASGWGSRTVVRLSANEMETIHRFCKNTFDA